MKANKSTKIAMVLAIINYLLLIIVGLFLPDLIPIHIDATGMIDWMGNKWLMISLFSILPIIIIIIKSFYESRVRQYKSNKKVSNRILNTIIIFFAFLSWTPIIMANYIIATGGSDALKIGTSTGILIYLLLGLPLSILFIILGYYIGDIKPNRYLGIRTPWTLRSTEVWNKTHIFARYFTIAGGLILLASSIATVITNNPYVLVAGLLLAIVMVALIPIIYSYWAFKKIS
ncbi:MAG: SdpI family protein [Methanobacteriaceae archaeon]